MQPELDGVPATALWTLHNRAGEAARPDGCLRDPQAVRLRDRIDHPYDETFGGPTQPHALRARAFDTALRAHLAAHPDGTVVALGEGLQTTFWRLDDPRVRWWSVDLPEIIALRETMLPAEPRVRTLACSALDLSWQDRIEPVDADLATVAVTAEGLLMYFSAADALGLIDACARRFPGGRMLFDTIPPWVSRRSLSGWALTPSYTAPPMPWGVTLPELRRAVTSLPGVTAVRELAWPPGRGVFSRPSETVLGALPGLSAHRPCSWCVEFAAREP